MKIYTYINNLGRKKELRIGEKGKNEQYNTSIWDCATGEICGAGSNTKEEIVTLLKHYGITEFNCRSSALKRATSPR